MGVGLQNQSNILMVLGHFLKKLLKADILVGMEKYFMIDMVVI